MSYKITFFRMYHNLSVGILGPLNLTGSKVGMIPFCHFPTTSQSNDSLISTSSCSLFDPMMTSKGYCYSFNSLSVRDLYKSSEVVETWNSNLNLRLDSNVLNSPGFGSANGLNFILNAHEPFSQQRSSKNFILSISNENNPYDIYEHNFVIEPGNFYTFKVLANQVSNLKNLFQFIVLKG